MPLPKRPHVASPDEVRINREGDAAVIEYADPKVAVTHFTIGKEELAKMTDEDVLALWNEGIEATEDLARDHDHVAVEIPLGKRQLKYFEAGDQWVPRGDVLRGEVLGFDPDESGRPVHLDRRPGPHADRVRQDAGHLRGGWGVRMVFVPVDEVHELPPIEVGEPEDEG